MASPTKALSDALKRLERNGLISRRMLPTQPIGVEYLIISLRESLREPFNALYNWSAVNGTELNWAQELYERAKEHDIGEGKS